MIKDQVSYSQYFLAVLVSFVAFSLSANAQTTIISSPYSTTVNLGTTVASAPRMTCVDLSYDLYQGLSDSASDTSIIKLQRYLVAKGYLVATPNGYFGPGTLSAVKKFQGANGISNTGRVGPATRKVIRDDSCNANSTASVINSLPTSTPVPNSTSVNASNLTVTSPYASSTLNTDSALRIQWKNIPRAIYGIMLEDINGLGAGHIAQSISGDSYEWKVGKVFSARTNSDIYVPPGIYRIKLTNSGFTSVSTPDQYSGLFTINAKPITITSIMPGAISNADNSSAVIYGSGFDSSSRIHLDITGNDRTIKPYFVSSDGKILVFNVDRGIYPNQYFVTVNNTFENGATSSPSNPASLTVNNN